MNEKVPRSRMTGATEAVERVYRDERAAVVAVVAGLIRLCGDFSLAEDVVHDALSRAPELDVGV
jgi:predicted RNA polymerase sigma factor